MRDIRLGGDHGRKWPPSSTGCFDEPKPDLTTPLSDASFASTSMIGNPCDLNLAGTPMRPGMSSASHRRRLPKSDAKSDADSVKHQRLGRTGKRGRCKNLGIFASCRPRALSAISYSSPGGTRTGAEFLEKTRLVQSSRRRIRRTSCRSAA